MTTTSPLAVIELEIQRKQQEIAELERVAKILRVLPDHSPEEFEAVAGVLRRLGNTDRSGIPNSAQRGTSANNGTPNVASLMDRSTDFVNMVIAECAAQILSENKGMPLHYRKLAEQSVLRGYSSGREGTTAEKVVSSFKQTLNRMAREGDRFERSGPGMFRLLAKGKADEG
jgi:hypothetical protein